MKKILFFALLAASFSVTAQNVNYSLDMIRPDSFYLIETITALPSKEVPRPATQTNQMLFRGDADWDKFLLGMADYAAKQEDEAAKLRAEAQKKAEDAAIIKARATAIKGLRK